MKEYTYKGFTFRRTSILHANTLKPLYEIDELKECGQRPFLTTIKDCRYYIREHTGGAKFFRLSMED